MEAVIPVKVKELSWRTAQPLNQSANIEAMLDELDFVDESRNFAAMKEAAVKQVTDIRYNRNVRPKYFNPGDLVLRRADVGNKTLEKKSCPPTKMDHTESSPTQQWAPTSL
jgi:hypothetical protein